MARAWLRALIWIILSLHSVAWAKPPKPRLIIEELNYKYRVSLLIPASLYLSDIPDSRYVDPIAIEKVFRKTLRSTSFQLNRSTCEWGLPAGHLSPSAIYLQAILFCPQEVALKSIQWKLGFLESWPTGTTLNVDAYLETDRSISMILNNEQDLIEIAPIPAKDAFNQGITFMGLNPWAWLKSSQQSDGKPLGLWLLFYVIYIGLMAKSLKESIRSLVFYTVALIGSLIISYQWIPLPAQLITISTVAMISFILGLALQGAKRSSAKLFWLSLIGSLQGSSYAAVIPHAPTNISTASIFAAFQVGALIGTVGILAILLPGARWYFYQLKSSKVKSIIQFTVLTVSLLTALI